ncbi:MAG: adenosylcobinamide-GDP ribazoletransferase [Sarcina sp.]
MINKFKLILSFFTRIPVGKIDYSEEAFKKSIKFTPIVGIFIGSILLLISKLLINIENKLIVGFILMLTYLWITGGLHLDGLSDSFDGLFSGRSKERILEIMKDSRIGAFGVLALIVTILGYAMFLGEVNVIILFIMPIIGRSSLYLASKLSKYGRLDGMGKTFIENGSTKDCRNIFIIINIICIIIGVIFKVYLIIISMIISYSLVFRIVKFVEKKIDGITGDILGMIVEITQITFLISSYILINIS